MKRIKIKKSMMIPIVFLFLVGVFFTWKYVFLPSSHERETSSKSRPNIVLIIVDALRADKLGVYGFPGDISPEIDAMAREGILFENVISQSSWTRPSIGSLLTSLYPRSIGIYKEKYDILHDKYLTLAEILKAGGYRTFGITANPNINKVFNFHQGFDDYRDSAVIWKWMKNEPGKRKPDEDTHLRRSKDIFDTTLEKIKSYGTEPFYIQINIMEAHSPYLIRDEYKGVFKDYPVKKVNYNYPEEKLARIIRWTLGAVKQVSYDIGEFVKKIQAIPGMENTLFVITSDHGQGLNDHPDVDSSHTHGNLLYESNLRVPLIFYHPGKIVKPHRVKNRVRLLDLMPTILDYVGISYPESLEIHGKSLINLIENKGEAPQLPDYFIAETHWRKVNKIAVYTAEWKYFENKDHWKGVNARELQPAGIRENGTQTDKIQEEMGIGKEMKKALYLWEKRFKPVKRTFPRDSLTREEIRQLKSLGYLN